MNNPLNQLPEELLRRLTTADALLALDNYGQRDALPSHLQCTLQDLLRPVCDNNNRLHTLMSAILTTEDEPASATWLRLREQWITEDRERLWRVRIEVQAPGATPRDAAEHAWDALVHDAAPKVQVWPADSNYTTAVDVDLDEPASTEGTAAPDSDGGEPDAPLVAEFEDGNIGLRATIRFEIETAGEWVLRWHDSAIGVGSERHDQAETAFVVLAARIVAAREERRLVDCEELLVNIERFLAEQLHPMT